MSMRDRDGRPERSYVELHRSYGVRRRLRPWKEKIELGVYKIFLFWVLGVLSLAAGLAIVNFFLYFPELWFKLLLAILIVVTVGLRLTRAARKRAKFMRGLRKYCRGSGDTLTTRQGFFEWYFSQYSLTDRRIRSRASRSFVAGIIFFFLSSVALV